MSESMMVLFDTGKNEPLGELSAAAHYESAQKKLVVLVDEGRNLKACDSNGLSDPYVVVRIFPDQEKRWKEQKTKICKKTLNPVFHEQLEYAIKPNELGGLKLSLMVWDDDTIGWDFMGEIVWDLSKIPSRNGIPLEGVIVVKFICGLP